jgi:hypothetical protein
MGEAQQAKLNFAAAAEAYSVAVIILEKLDQARALRHPFFRGLLSEYRIRGALCRKADSAVADLKFVLNQPAAEMPELLNIRLRVLAKRNDRAGVVITAEAYSKLAEKDASRCYSAACAWGLASRLAKIQGREPTKVAEEYAGRAMALLRKAMGAGKSFENSAAMAARIRQDKDMEPLRHREDFKTLLAELEAKQ